MKRIATIFGMLIISYNLIGQVFNGIEYKYFRRGDFVFAFEPAIHTNDPSKGFNFKFYGNYAINKTLSWEGRLAGGGLLYIGSGFKWNVNNTVITSVGIHYFDNPGLDGSINFSLPLSRDIRFYTGGDSDCAFSDNGIQLYAWIPVGIVFDIDVKKSFFIEADVAVLGPTKSHIIGVGLLSFLK